MSAALDEALEAVAQAGAPALAGDRRPVRPCTLQRPLTEADARKIMQLLADMDAIEMGGVQ